jgi:transcriptional regulator with XRE-family HTH domain
MPVCKQKSCPHRIRFGENLVSLRKRQKLTQEQMAERVGMSTRYIQNLEAGDNFPTLPILVRLKEVLGCSWGKLFDGCERVSK